MKWYLELLQNDSVCGGKRKWMRIKVESGQEDRWDKSDQELIIAEASDGYIGIHLISTFWYSYKMFYHIPVEFLQPTTLFNWGEKVDNSVQTQRLYKQCKST
jgi:hypothetical protein